MTRIRSATSIAVLVAAVCVAPPAAHAAPSMHLGWDRPGGPADKDFTAGPVDLYVTVQGLTAPMKAMQVFIRVTPRTCPWDTDLVPDAWSFATGGCQAGRACFEPGNFGELATGPIGPMRITDLSSDPLGGLERAVLAEVYEDPFVPDPGQTYTVLRLRFDHSFSVDDTVASPGHCAGERRTMRLLVEGGSWFDTDRVEHPFALSQDLVWWDQPDGVGFTANRVHCSRSDDPPASLLSGGAFLASTLPPCEVPVPAVHSTWGRLKSAYR